MTAPTSTPEHLSLRQPGVSDALPGTVGLGEVRTVRVVLVRHGEWRRNAGGIVQGQSCRGRSQRGLDQAEQLPLTLQRELPDAAVVVLSDLQRVAETARPYEWATVELSIDGLERQAQRCIPAPRS